jgi:hypothetical protein
MRDGKRECPHHRDSEERGDGRRFRREERQRKRVYSLISSEFTFVIILESERDVK